MRVQNNLRLEIRIERLKLQEFSWQKQPWGSNQSAVTEGEKRLVKKKGHLRLWMLHMYDDLALTTEKAFNSRHR